MQVTMALHRWVQQGPDDVMTVFGERTRTVAECADRVARLAAGLRALGVGEGDRVAVLGLNSDRYHELLLACPWMGAVIVPVNIRWSPEEIVFSLNDCDASVVCIDDAFGKVAPVIRDRVEGLRDLVHIGESPTPEGMVDYESLIADHAPVPDAGKGGDDLLGLFYTGGTTGFPKGVMLSHDNFLSSSMGIMATTPVITPGGRVLHAAPMFHLADLALWSLAMMAGATHVIIPMFIPEGTIAAIRDHEVTDALLVPTMLQMVLDSPAAADADLPSLSHILYGASAITDAVLARAREVFSGAGFIQAYGMTEMGPVVTVLTPQDHTDPGLKGSCGRAAFHMELKVVDAEGNEVPRGTVGEIWARGDNMMQGYWNRPEETAAALEGGWMHTGDGGRMDERGYVFIADRIKDMIITGGENVYSAEVENVLARHPAVAQSAVIGLPDDRWGERVHAVVVLRPDAEVTPQQLSEFCREHIAGYKVPRSVAFVDQLPISGAGKVLKRDLRKQDWSDAATV